MYDASGNRSHRSISAKSGGSSAWSADGRIRKVFRSSGNLSAVSPVTPGFTSSSCTSSPLIPPYFQHIYGAVPEGASLPRPELAVVPPPPVTPLTATTGAREVSASVATSGGGGGGVPSQPDYLDALGMSVPQSYRTREVLRANPNPRISPAAPLAPARARSSSAKKAWGPKASFCRRCRCDCNCAHEEVSEATVLPAQPETSAGSSCASTSPTLHSAHTTQHTTHIGTGFVGESAVDIANCDFADLAIPQVRSTHPTPRSTVAHMPRRASRKHSASTHLSTHHSASARLSPRSALVQAAQTKAKIHTTPESEDTVRKPKRSKKLSHLTVSTQPAQPVAPVSVPEVPEAEPEADLGPAEVYELRTEEESGDAVVFVDDDGDELEFMPKDAPKSGYARYALNGVLRPPFFAAELRENKLEGTWLLRCENDTQFRNISLPAHPGCTPEEQDQLSSALILKFHKLFLWCGVRSNIQVMSTASANVKAAPIPAPGQHTQTSEQGSTTSANAETADHKESMKSAPSSKISKTASESGTEDSDEEEEEEEEEDEEDEPEDPAAQRLKKRLVKHEGRMKAYWKGKGLRRPTARPTEKLVRDLPAAELDPAPNNLRVRALRRNDEVTQERFQKTNQDYAQILMTHVAQRAAINRELEVRDGNTTPPIPSLTLDADQIAKQVYLWGALSRREVQDKYLSGLQPDNSSDEVPSVIPSIVESVDGYYGVNPAYR